MLEGSGTSSRETFEMIGAIWSILMYYLIRFSLKKVPLFIIKNNDYSYTPVGTCLLAMGYFAPRET